MKHVKKALPYLAGAAAGIAFVSLTTAGANLAVKVRLKLKGA